MKNFSTIRESLQSFTMPDVQQIDAASTLAVYQALRPILPQPVIPQTQKADRFRDILDQFDALILDGFGVINVGPEKIDGIDEVLIAAQERWIIIIVLTNAASHPSSLIASKYKGWNLPIDGANVVSSRDAIESILKETPPPQPVMTLGHSVTLLGYAEELTAKDDYDAAESFVLLGTTEWHEEDQQRLEAALLKRMRPLYVANPDVSAPQLRQFSPEAGYFAARAMQATGVEPVWGGKPHSAAFTAALCRVDAIAGYSVDRSRLAMVGASPHTDILGGLGAGICSVLISSYGLLRNYDAEAECARLGIMPHWIVRAL